MTPTARAQVFQQCDVLQVGLETCVEDIADQRNSPARNIEEQVP